MNIQKRTSTLNNMTHEEFLTQMNKAQRQSQSFDTTKPISKNSSAKITPSVSFKIEKSNKIDEVDSLKDLKVGKRKRVQSAIINPKMRQLKQQVAITNAVNSNKVAASKQRAGKNIKH